ncbi:MAG: NAD(P)-dependent oxidoreductase, partial [Wenzhouxiangellaceae bacterium]
MTATVSQKTGSTVASAGFIGLGAMGAPMAGHLHRCGLLGAVWNRSPGPAAKFVAACPDAVVAESLEALVGMAEAVLICVSADEDLRQIIDHIEPVLCAGQVVVDHSSVAPATARDIAGRLAKTGVAFVDAPVTGGVEGAANGRLAIMAGGQRSVIERLDPIFSAYAAVWHHLGDSGAGQSAKAVNQLMVSGIAEAVCEALALVERLDHRYRAVTLEQERH